MKVEEIRLDDIIIPEQRARATFSPEQEAELRASIEQNGFTIPILVRKIGDGKYELIDGEHRISVVRELGWEKIPAVISEIDDSRATLLNILANTARGSQNPMDVADALRRAYEAGVTEEELAAATGHTTSWVKLYLTLTELPEQYREALKHGALKVGHIQEAMRLNDPVEIDACLQSVLTHGWNVKVTKYYVDERLASLERARAAGDTEFLETPPTPQYAQEVVQYGECMMCHRKVNRMDLSMPTMCPDCRTLLEWIIDQLGDPKGAMQTIYAALQVYFDVQRRARMSAPQPVQPPRETPAQQAPPVPYYPTPGNQGTAREQDREAAWKSAAREKQAAAYGLTEEEMRLVKMIRAMKEAGML